MADQEEIRNGCSEKVAAETPVVFTAVLEVEAPESSDAVQLSKAAFGAEELSRASRPKPKADQELPLPAIIASDLSSPLQLVQKPLSGSEGSGGSATGKCKNVTLNADSVSPIGSPSSKEVTATVSSKVASDSLKPLTSSGRKRKDPYFDFRNAMEAMKKLRLARGGLESEIQFRAMEHFQNNLSDALGFASLDEASMIAFMEDLYGPLPFSQITL